MQDSNNREQSLSNARWLPKFFVITLIALLCTANAVAGGKSSKSGVRISNFGQVDERIYRGAQPKQEEFNDLAALGIATVIDLRDDSEKYEQGAAEAAGLRYFRIPMDDTKAPTDAQVGEFLKIIDNTANGKIYVHCKGGRHRTGVMVAAYRFAHYNWTPQQAYDEMKVYDFYTRWGHGALKDYVFNYKAPSASPSAASEASAANAGVNSSSGVAEKSKPR